MGGTLAGLRVVELSGMGPAPHAAMMLADLGAEVVRVVGPAPPVGGYRVDTHLQRSRTTVRADLKNDGELASVRSLVAAADVLLEGYRPGTAERLGLGPAECLAANPRLVYARMTGWGQDGPLAQRAGHDINYIALTGALHAMGPADRPVPPLNLVGDFGGGSLFVVTGILAALWERERSGLGQVVDAAMVDGVSVLSQLILELRSVGLWNDTRGANLLDGAAPFYRTYECAGGGFVAVGAIEPQFYAALLEGLGLAGSGSAGSGSAGSGSGSAGLPDRDDPSQWPTLAAVLAAAFATRTRDAWAELFEATDACVTPVLTFAEAALHPHVAARGTLSGSGADIVAAPAPRFSRSAAPPPGTDVAAADIESILNAWRAP
ncbi:alpha-methylacyl-CoA racemase [Arthrobacter silviterrae]|uniref:CoA transferase n=1 Tax=Arthrobacter silviterrae TaxID=2026658 RepID=A0ABX0DDB1_9MICC|nr:CaiB/BaiF CoA-transferase family protein [Arthrobacter silviterrae]MDQ0277166.1 alpha-methylacyl-CoA racemase [Arthrobacter silviterrae]NGN83721.1 CoA transferase [Arthrobacter silviterrae]